MSSAPVDAVFDSLTRSALDFLNQAARQVKKAPKYAVINLATAIELLLKARLVKEHWSLVMSRPEKANLVAFNAGTFHSVGLDEAVERLRNIAGVTLSKDEETCFRDLRDHRNKLVHFYHDTYLAGPDPVTLAAIAAEQCRAWFFVRRLLEDRWAPLFKPYKKEIARCQRLIEKNREYLAGKFMALRPEIEADRKIGVEYETCGACGHESSKLSPGPEPVVESACAVCGRRNDFLRVPCPACTAEIRIQELGESTCGSCGFETTLTWVTEQYGPYEDPKGDPESGYCSYCENVEVRSVVPLGGVLICLSCLEEHSSIGQCGWCSEYVAGDMEDSYLTGCLLCSGRMAWDDD